MSSTYIMTKRRFCITSYFPAKYRREVFSESVSSTLREVCIGISMRYEIRFVEVGMDEECAFSRTTRTNNIRKQDCDHNQKHYCSWNLFPTQRSENVSLGREPLNKRFLREHCERIRQCGRYQAVHCEPRDVQDNLWTTTWLWLLTWYQLNLCIYCCQTDNIWKAWMIYYADIAPRWIMLCWWHWCSLH